MLPSLQGRIFVSVLEIIDLVRDDTSLTVVLQLILL